MGIDPGVAACVVDRDGRPLEVREIDRIEKLCRLLGEFGDSLAVVVDMKERRNKVEWSARAFDSGYLYGITLGVCGALKVPTVLSAPPRWERALGITGGSQGYAAVLKDKLAGVKVPDSAVRAALLAIYGVEILKRSTN